jgi:hypothetical protein
MARDRADRFRELIGSHKCAGQQTDGCQAATRSGGRGQKRAAGAGSDSPRYDPAAQQVLLGVRFEPTDTQRSHNRARGRGLRRRHDVAGHLQDGSAISRIFLPEERKQLLGPVGQLEGLNEAIGFALRKPSSCSP